MDYMGLVIIGILVLLLTHLLTLDTSYEDEKEEEEHAGTDS